MKKGKKYVEDSKKIEKNKAYTKEEAIRKAELLMEYFKNNCIEGNENNG